MYLTVLTIHSWMRHVVLLLGLAAFSVAARGRSIHQARLADPWALAFVIALDLQVMIGLTLYGFLSPLGAPALTDLKAIMHVQVQRYWAVEHPFGMLTVFVLAHVGQVLVRRAPDDETRARRRYWWSFVPMAILLITLPWPFMPYARPWFRT